MDFVGDNYEVTNANMNNYYGDIEITGVSGNEQIRICVSLRKEGKDAEALQ
jgi:hypothetical protein